ncbi:hypothetical protein YC2023_102449 [Brassica napus]
MIHMTISIYLFHTIFRLSSSNDSTSEKQYRGVQKLEAISVGELNIYVLETPHKLLSAYAKPQLFLWKLQTYGVTSHVPSVRRSSSEEFISSHALHVEILMGEGEDTALIVVFDSAMTKLTCVRAAEVVNPMGQGDQDPADYEFPQLLQDIVGNTYIFHLKLNEANFSSHHKSFTVARIFDHNERISGPTFAPHGGGNNHDDDMHGSNCASCKYHLGDSSTGGNPPEAGDEPIETSDAVQPTSNTEQKESIVENVDDPHGSPTENKSKKC